MAFWRFFNGLQGLKWRVMGMIDDGRAAPWPFSHVIEHHFYLDRHGRASRPTLTLSRQEENYSNRWRVTFVP